MGFYQVNHFKAHIGIKDTSIFNEAGATLRKQSLRIKETFL